MSIRRWAATIVAVTALSGISGGVFAASASAAPGDLDVAVNGIQDFGYQREGVVVTHTLVVTNIGRHDVRIDPSNLSGLTAPFSASTTINPAITIIPNESKEIVVTYTPPVATGVADMMTVTLPVADQITAGATTILTLNLRGQSVATAPAAFDAIPARGGTTLDFGVVRPGGTSSAGVELHVGGFIPIGFRENHVSALDLGGNPIPGVRLTASSFGTGTAYVPGAVATFEMTFAPVAPGPVSGVIQIEGNESRMGDEGEPVIVNLPFTAVVEAAVVPTPTPTSTPVPSAVAGQPSVVRPGVAGGQQLAHTGAQPEVAVGFGVLTLALGGIALAVVAGMRRKARQN